MQKLLEALATLPEAEIEEMVGMYFDNQLFAIVAEDTPEKQSENLKKLNEIRNHVLVAALSESARAEMNELIDSAERLVSINDDDED